MNCDYCGHAVRDDSAYAIGKSAEKRHQAYAWEVDTISTDFGPLTLVEKSNNREDGDSYGELPQGTTFEAWKVYRLEGHFPHRYFKKTGHGDSYGEVQWNGPFAEVKAVPQQVISYEYVETN